MNVNWPFLVVIVGIAVAVWWVIANSSAVFAVQVRSGCPVAVRGKVTDAFLSEVRDVFHEFDLSAGVVRGVASGQRIALRFSHGVPPAAQQRLRNWWVISGWSAGARRS